MAAPLLPFHKSILETVHDPATSDFLILARGLGLRRVVATLLQIYDSPQNLVLLVNAAADEEAALGEELGIMGCRNPGLRVVDYEMPKKERCVRKRRLGSAAGLLGEGRSCINAAG
jgi:DNA excision repair protein ERCC-4